MDKRIPLKSGDAVHLSNDVYTITQLISRGGSSLIYEAERRYCETGGNNICINKRVLLKELAPFHLDFHRKSTGEIIFEHADISAMRQLFDNEINCLAYIQSKNHSNNRIPDMDAFGEYNNTVYIAMNHIKGVLLSSYLGHRRLSDDKILDIFLQLLRIISFLHIIDKNYCHLDLKPNNFIIDATDTVFLIDFGSSIISENKRVNNYTEDYSAPEVVYNMLELIDQRSDIYSLGAILYEMVTGSRASLDTFLLCGGDYCGKALCARYDYNALLSKMLAEDAGDRFATVEEIIKVVGAMKDINK
ncbi:Protein kinase domain-containing protein [Sporobacter termitidis DSM 10068]|uniref:Protein kinase domain-containing protein n=1 Tax=Sporobacter termitidis DSM 10068 TaxID=1123282 RepID=A0A1M5ZDE6_9FIRM|nr:protein kinase [Sporobacter termitidis]SHI22204.1 Protein kinase domain-containing protein [Sporobacter termitidis DSM 10068]